MALLAVADPWSCCGGRRGGRNSGGAQGVRSVLLLLCAVTEVSVFYSFLPSLVSLHSLSLLFLYFWTMMVLSVVAGRSDGGAGGGATVALLLPLLPCSFTLLSPFSSFFFCFARAPLLSNKLSPLFSVLPPLFSVLLQNFAPRFVPLFLKKKSSPPPLLICSLPCIYRQPGERFTIPCPSAGHGGVGVARYGCVGVGMGHAGFLGKWGGERGGKNSRKSFQKSPSPLSLHLQGRRSCTVPFKTAPCRFFFF